MTRETGLEEEGTKDGRLGYEEEILERVENSFPLYSGGNTYVGWRGSGLGS